MLRITNLEAVQIFPFMFDNCKVVEMSTAMNYSMYRTER